MEIKVESPHFTINSLLQEYIIRKVGRLSHFNKRFLSAEVLLKLDKSDTDDNKVCEIKLVGPRKDLFATCKASTFEDAITEVIHSLEKQMRKQKTRYGSDKEKINVEDTEGEETEL